MCPFNRSPWTLRLRLRTLLHLWPLIRVVAGVAVTAGLLEGVATSPANAGEAPGCPNYSVTSTPFGSAPEATETDFVGCEVGELESSATSSLMSGSDQVAAWYAAGLDRSLPSAQFPSFVRQRSVRCGCWNRTPRSAILFYSSTPEGQYRLFAVEKWIDVAGVEKPEGAFGELLRGLRGQLPTEARPSATTERSTLSVGQLWSIYRWRVPSQEVVLAGGAGNALSSMTAYVLVVSRAEWDAVVRRFKDEQAAATRANGDAMRRAGSGL